MNTSIRSSPKPPAGPRRRCRKTLASWKSGDAPVEVHRGLWETVLSGKEWRGASSRTSARTASSIGLLLRLLHPGRGERHHAPHRGYRRTSLERASACRRSPLQAQKMENFNTCLGRRGGPRFQQPAHRHTGLFRSSRSPPCSTTPRSAGMSPRSGRPRAGLANLTRQLLAFSCRQVVAAVELDLNPVVSVPSQDAPQAHRRGRRAGHPALPGAPRPGRPASWSRSSSIWHSTLMTPCSG